MAEGAAATSALRNQGAKGVIDKARQFLKGLDLYEFANCTTEDQFSTVLNEKTKALQKSFPRGAKKNWGAARKVLNLFLRDILYNQYLSRHFGFRRLEIWLEVPLDSFAAKGIWSDYKPQTLPRWKSIKSLTYEDSQDYQKAAAAIASSCGFARVHLDILYWRDIGQKGKGSQ